VASSATHGDFILKVTIYTVHPLSSTASYSGKYKATVEIN
jgi:hypothetical protein